MTAGAACNNPSGEESPGGASGTADRSRVGTEGRASAPSAPVDETPSVPPEPDRPARAALAGVAAGGHATCAWSSHGRVRCAGSLVAQDPGGAVTVEGVAGVEAVATNGARACARESSGAVKCWSASTAPTEIAPAKNASQLAVGDNVSCAVVGGQIWCWAPGEVAKRYFDGGAAADASFIDVASSLRRVIGIDDEGRRYEVHSTGAVESAVDAYDGQDRGVARILGGNDAFVLVGKDGRPLGRLRPWPEGFVPDASFGHGLCGRNAAGKLGCHGSSLTRWGGGAPEWTSLATIPSVAMISGGTRHVCVLDEAGHLWCIGNADQGQLGATPPARLELEATRATPSDVDHVFAQGKELCVRIETELQCSSDPAFAAWGESDLDSEPAPRGAVYATDGSHLWAALEGRRIALSSGTYAKRPRGAKSIAEVTGDSSFACLRFDDGRVGCLDDDDLELRVDARDATPKLVAGLAGSEQLVANAYGVCGRDATGTVSCVGAHRRWASSLPTLAGDTPEAFFEEAQSLALVDASVCAKLPTGVTCKTVALATPPPKARGWVVPELQEEGAERAETKITETRTPALADAARLIATRAGLCGVVNHATLRCVLDLQRLVDGEAARVLEVDFPVPIAAVAFSRGHGCAMLRDASLHCFGDVGAPSLGARLEATPLDVTARFLAPPPPSRAFVPDHPYAVDP